MNSRRRRHAFQPSIDILPCRIAPTVFTPPPPMSIDHAPPAMTLDRPTTLAVPDDPLSMTPPNCSF